MRKFTRCVPGLWRAALLALFAAIPAGASQFEEYEVAPTQQAASLLSSEMLDAHGCRVTEAVANDGTMNRYSLTSRWGDFEAYGKVQLALRLRECAALEELEHISTSDAFVGAVTRAAMKPIETAGDLLGKPVETLTGIPKGIGRLFERFSYQASEASQQIANHGQTGAGAEDDDRAGQSAPATASYARKYLGISAAERRWYMKLEMDPYTRNSPLRHAVGKVARVDAVASFGMKLAIPSVPGVGDVQSVMDVVWKEDPVLLRKHNREFLAERGLDARTISAFENNPSLSPTQQVAIVQAMREIRHVAGCELLVTRASEVQSDDEADVFVGSVSVLLSRHRGGDTLSEVLPGIRFPVARLTAGGLIVTAALDGLHWTEPVAAAVRRFISVYADDPETARQLWTIAPPSARFAAEVGRLGWSIDSLSP